MDQIGLDNTTLFTASNIFVFAFVVCFLKLRFSKILSAGIAIGGLSLVVFLDYLRFVVMIDLHPWLSYLVTGAQVIVLQTVVLLLTQYRDGRSLFTGLAASNFVLPGLTLGILAFTLTKNLTFTLLLVIAFNTVLLLTMISVARKAYLRIQSRGCSGWLSLCLVPCMFYLLFFFLMGGMPPTLKMSLNEYLPALFTVITMIVTYVVTMRYIAQRSDEGVRKEVQALLEGYTKSLTMEAHNLIEKQDSLAILRHDTRHYFSMLSVMLAEKDYESMGRVLDELSGTLENSTPQKYCDDPVFNSAMTAIAATAAAKGVRLETSIIMPTIPSEAQIRFAAITVNLIENAIQASSRISDDSIEKVVRVTAKSTGNLLFFEVQNSKDKRIEIDKESLLPKTNQGANHGFGLRSVQEFAELFGGLFDYSHSETLFTARLSIPLTKEEYDSTEEARDFPSPK